MFSVFEYRHDTDYIKTSTIKQNILLDYFIENITKINFRLWKYEYSSVSKIQHFFCFQP